MGIFDWRAAATGAVGYWEEKKHNERVAAHKNKLDLTKRERDRADLSYKISEEEERTKRKEERAEKLAKEERTRQTKANQALARRLGGFSKEEIDKIGPKDDVKTLFEMRKMFPHKVGNKWVTKGQRDTKEAEDRITKQIEALHPTDDKDKIASLKKLRNRYRTMSASVLDKDLLDNEQSTKTAEALAKAHMERIKEQNRSKEAIERMKNARGGGGKPTQIRAEISKGITDIKGIIQKQVGRNAYFVNQQGIDFSRIGKYEVHNAWMKHIRTLATEKINSEFVEQKKTYNSAEILTKLVTETMPFNRFKTERPDLKQSQQQAQPDDASIKFAVKDTMEILRDFDPNDPQKRQEANNLMYELTQRYGVPLPKQLDSLVQQLRAKGKEGNRTPLRPPPRTPTQRPPSASSPIPRSGNRAQSGSPYR